MKKLASLALLIAISNTTIAQHLNYNGHSIETDYLKRSKNQKVAAFSLLVIGVAGAGLGGVAVSLDNDFGGSSSGGILVAAGGSAIIGGVILFIASAKNKRKANGWSFQLQFEKFPAISEGALIRYNCPTAAIKISL